MRSAIERMQAAERGDDDPLESDIAFHVAVLRASMNRFYAQLTELTATALRFSIRTTNRYKGVQLASVADHKKVADAILAGRPAAAQEAMRKLIQEAMDLIISREERHTRRSTGGRRTVRPPRMSKIRVAIVGLGKIARDQHVPVIAASDDFELVAVASPNSRLDGVKGYANLDDLLRAEQNVDAVALCTTPQVRYDAARLALERGVHVLLEKPPGVTVTEVQALVSIAERKGVALFASWHSRHAAAVAKAREWLAQRRITSVSVAWKEDVRVWHPGQKWIWQAGGLGVFDPGINALSILTRILPARVALREAPLSPSRRTAKRRLPRSSSISSSAGAPVRVELDFLQTGPQTWDIVAETDAGRLRFKGGTVMKVDDRVVRSARSRVRESVRAFRTLVRERRIDVDLAPFQLVADALSAAAPPHAPFIE